MELELNLRMASEKFRSIHYSAGSFPYIPRGCNTVMLVYKCRTMNTVWRDIFTHSERVE
jgi:hypothetical protein